MSEKPEQSGAADEPEEASSKSRESEIPSEATETPKSAPEEKEPQPLSIEELLEAERKRVEELQTKLAYQQAEHANAVKAIERRRVQFIEQANRELLLQLLPVLDDLELSFLVVPMIEVNKSYIEGLKMVLEGFKATLMAAGVTTIKCEGQPFDPLRHEIISREETTEHPPNNIIEELRKGYLLKGKLLRTSLVKIAVPPDVEEKPEEPEEGPPAQDSE